MADRAVPRDEPLTRPAPALGEVFENLLAPELYATAATSVATVGGVVTVTFTSSRLDNSIQPPVRRQVVVGRVSLPVGGAADLVVRLYDFLAKTGVKFPTPAPGEMVQ